MRAHHGLAWLVAVALLASCTTGEVTGAHDASSHDGAGDERFLDPRVLTPEPEARDEVAERDGLDLDAEVVFVDDAGDDTPATSWGDVPDPPVPDEPEPLAEVLALEAPLEPLPSQLDTNGMRLPQCACSWCGPWTCASHAARSERSRGVRYAAVFNRRDGDGPATDIERAHLDLVRAATPGSTLEVAMCHFRQECMAWALVNAARCGVRVRVVIDGPRNLPDERAMLQGDARYYRAVYTLAEEGRRLDALRARDPSVGSIEVTACVSRERGSCRGDRLMHDKFIVVSRPGDDRPALSDGTLHAVGVSSHNFTAPQNQRHNALLVVRNDEGITRAYHRVFQEMVDSAGPATPANPYRFEDGDAPSRAFFFPRTDGPDTYIEQFERLRCRDGGGEAARVYVAMAFFTNARLEAARALRRMHDEGCAVQVIIDGSLERVSGRVIDVLRAGPRPVPLWIYRSDTWGLHSKYVLLRGPVTDREGRVARVLTGSHNLSSGSLRDNDETILRVDNARVYNAFLRDWEDVRRRSQRVRD